MSHKHTETKISHLDFFSNNDDSVEEEAHDDNDEHREVPKRRPEHKRDQSKIQIHKEIQEVIESMRRRVVSHATNLQEVVLGRVPGKPPPAQAPYHTHMFREVLYNATQRIHVRSCHAF